MHKGRLEAFSDGVIAIIITIMVLELKVPHTTDFAGLQPLLPVFVSYLLSFIYVGIYWNNHHHLLQAAQKVSGASLWANLHLLFWLSMIPFATAWMGENHFAAQPVALYGAVLFVVGPPIRSLQRFWFACTAKTQNWPRRWAPTPKETFPFYFTSVELPFRFLNHGSRWEFT